MTISELVDIDHAKTVAYHEQQLKSWQWQMANCPSAEAAGWVEYYTDMLENVLPEHREMQA